MLKVNFPIYGINMTNSNRLIEVPCPVCGSFDSKTVFQTQDYKQQITDDVFGVKRCRVCTVGYLSPRPTKEELPRYYDEHFYWSYENDEEARGKADAVLKIRSKQLEEKARWLANIVPGKLLDIGTMKGDFIYHMNKKGWSVEGVEFSETPPNLFDMPIKYGDFLHMNLEPESYDAITMWAVLEHVYEPREYVHKIAQLLKPGGTFIFLVTNFNSLQGRFFEWDDYPRHLTLFTKKSISKLANESGLEVVKTSTDQRIFGGHVRGGLVYLVKRLFGYSREEVLKEWKSDGVSDSFLLQWKSRPSFLIKQLSRVDKLLLLPLEYLADRLGFGFILTVEVKRPHLKESEKYE
jgi:SAM-dependent methyltransferase